MATDPSTGTKHCPFCAEEIRYAAVVCKHCKREIPPQMSAAVTANNPPRANPLGKKVLFLLIVPGMVAAGLIALRDLPPSSQRVQSSAAPLTPTKTAAAIIAERETARGEGAAEFEKNPEGLKKNLAAVAAMLKRDDLSGADSALKGIQAQVHLLMEGRLKDTAAVEDLRAQMDAQLSAASNTRIAGDRRARERSERVARQGVTAENYLRLRDGMTYEQVVEILGRAGTEISSSNIANISTVMYSWQGNGGLGANMNAMFQNGRLTMKAQFGLQ
jgi:hypothetical protein